MEALMSLLSQYWIVPVGVAILAAPSAVSFIKDKVGKISLPKLPSLKAKPVADNNSDALVSQDIQAIQWLANRAVDVNDEELILELENVNKKFFHIHRVMRKPAVSAE